MSYTILVTAPSLHPAGLKQLQARGCSVDFIDLDIGAPELHAKLAARPYDGIISRTVRLSAEGFDACPSLAAVSRHGVGLSNVDVGAASERNIAVFHTPGANAQAVAEYTFALLLACVRRIVRFDGSVRSGQWTRTGDGTQLQGKTIGLVGFGRIARKVAQLARSFEMKVIAFDPAMERGWDGDVEIFDSLNDMLKSCAVLSLHCPAKLGAPPIIGRAELYELPRGSVVINTARGELIDEMALYNALETGQVAGAGLDTFAVEPVASDNPLLSHPNTVVSPHIAGSTPEALAAMARGSVENLLSYLDLISGRPATMSAQALASACVNTVVCNKAINGRPATAHTKGSGR
ncbi:hydroxyacid dehydrogenase [Pelagibacterium flavum]|uniref:Hydroxyacid dehydrogenase n=1 Tax=Pelagibacterium flavum TaxID=2984530 RepID=A0ABY6ISC5_9HYPH|nr:hydroxyacid dehydrogenase [Pelagibacterium sp. YIM 151497]UYQ73532.1 hydroxyacid dehydrogenase [Pelagibacterium sp. YIM 151497]